MARPEDGYVPLKMKLWHAIVLLGLLLAFGIWTYVDLVRMERRGGSVVVSKLEAAIYRSVGKNGVLIFDLGLAGLMAAAIVKGVRDSRKLDEVQARLEAPRPGTRPALDPGPAPLPPRRHVAPPPPAITPSAPVEPPPAEGPKLLR
jgi:hypothetical protein